MDTSVDVSRRFANDFVERLKSGHIQKENLPNTGKELSTKYVQEHLKAYDELVESKFLDKFYEE